MDLEQTVEAAAPTGALVDLDASGSYDPDDDPLTYTWTGPFGAVEGMIVQVAIPLGMHQITLTVSDGIAATTATTTVNVVDTTPPVIMGGPVTPPNSNGWYNQDVTVSFEAYDNASGIALAHAERSHQRIFSRASRQVFQTGKCPRGWRPGLDQKDKGVRPVGSGRRPYARAALAALAAPH